MVEKDSIRINLLKGRNSENYVRWKLQGEGFKVVKLVQRGRDRKSNYDFNFLNMGLLNNILFKDYEEDTEELINFLKENINGLPDFICLKEGEISFVEVKSNHSGLNENQKKTFQVLRDNGFRIIIRNINVNLEINEN